MDYLRRRWIYVQQVKPYFETYKELKEKERLLSEIKEDLKKHKKLLNLNAFMEKKRNERLNKIGFFKQINQPQSEVEYHHSSGFFEAKEDLPFTKQQSISFMPNRNSNSKIVMTMPRHSPQRTSIKSQTEIMNSNTWSKAITFVTNKKQPSSIKKGIRNSRTNYNTTVSHKTKLSKLTSESNHLISKQFTSSSTLQSNHRINRLNLNSSREMINWDHHL